MATRANPRIQAPLPDDLAEWLDGRSGRMNTGSRNRQATIELDMWRHLLTRELRRIRLTLPQASCIADVCNGWLMDATMGSYGAPLVASECEDAFAIARDVPAGLDPEVSSYGRKHGIDEKELLDYLGGLSPVADHALRDAIARWWHLDDAAPTVEGFARVGLRVTEITEEQR